jgi:hypothetical protein
VKIDFSPVQQGDLQLIDLARRFTVDDLRAAGSGSIDRLLGYLEGLNDADVIFNPHDPDAYDKYAPPGQEHIGWSLAHLVVHVTASTEEWAAYSSILARGIAYPADPRLRYETPWQAVTTWAECVQRLEESRRMRLAYLDTWPDKPFLEVRRQLSPRFIERVGEINAPAAFLYGLKHEVGHYDQFREVRRQALAAREQQQRV